jgi:hypothetical protein
MEIILYFVKSVLKIFDDCMYRLFFYNVVKEALEGVGYHDVN